MTASIVLLHSSASSGAQWRTLVERLGARYRVVAPDLYGYGSAPAWRGAGAFRLEHEAEAVLSVIERLGGPVHLVGHSYGGAVALHVARLHAKRLKSLAVIEPVAFHLLEDKSGIAGVAGRVAQALASGDYEGGMAQFVDYWTPGAWGAMPAERRTAMAARLGKVALDFHAAFNEPARAGDFRGLALPALLLRGTESPLPVQRICALLAGALPEARLETLEGAGHMSPLTHAAAVNQRIAEHIEAVQLRETTHGSQEDHLDFTRGIGGGLRQLAGA
jgi:pimeloyl-ACP methyl ester carboxylesterase